MFKSFIQNLSEINPETGKKQIIELYEDYLKSKKQMKPFDKDFKREREFDLVRDQMIDAFVHISNFDSNREPVVDLFAVLRSMLNLGICMLHNVFSKKMLKIVYSSVHSQLAPNKLSNFLQNHFQISPETCRTIQDSVYQKFTDKLFTKLNEFNPQLIVFLLKLIPAHFFKRKQFISFVQSHLDQ